MIKPTIMKVNFKTLFILTAIVLAGYFAHAQNNKTLLICIDGCNSSVIDYAYSPVVQKLIDNATYSTSVQLRGNAHPTSGWASLLTGAYSSNHGVTRDSTWEGNNFENYPLIFDRIRTETSEQKTAAIVTSSLLYEIVQTADYYELAADDDGVETSMANLLSFDNETSLFFVEFEGMFKAGIEDGFTNSSMEYVNAFSTIDQRIGNLLRVIEGRTNYELENWTVIISSNHGGRSDGKYGGDSKNEITIPVIISGDNIDNRNLATGLSDAKPDKNNSIQIDPESTSDYQYVMIKKTGTKLEDMQDFTIEFKVYADQWTSDPSIIGDKDWGSGGNPGFTICRRGSSFKLNLSDTDGNRIDISSSVVIEDGDWHHVAVAFNPQDSVYIYVDGERTGGAKMNYATSAVFASPFDYLAIGNEGTLEYPNWKGIIDEVRIWDVVVDGVTIKEFYKKEHVETLNHPYLDNLLAYYKMDGTQEVDGAKVVDSGPNLYHGTLVRCKRVHVSPLKNTDIYPTIIESMGGTVQREWLLNGDAVKNDVKFILGEGLENGITANSHYPNPVASSQHLNVVIPDDFKGVGASELKVIDMNGILYRIDKISINGNETIPIDMNGLKSGYYIYSIRSGGRYLLGKFQVNN